MTWLVTGGAGYIGAAVVRAVQADGRPVVVLDDLSTGDRRTVPPHVPFIRASVCDVPAVRRVLVDHAVTGVIHLAGRKSVAESLAAPRLYHRQNAGGTQALLTAMAGVGVDQLVFASSAAVYGLPEADLVGEDGPLEPLNPYGASKLTSERMIRDAARAHGLRYLILRYFNVAGAGVPGGRRPADSSLLACAMDAIARGAPPVVFGRAHPTADGSCIRDFVHVLDVASAHALAVDALEAGSGSAVYNVGSGTGHSVLQVLDRIREVTGVDFAVETRPPREGDPARVVACRERIHQDLGWLPTRALDEIVRGRWELSLARRAPHRSPPVERPAAADEMEAGGRTGRIQVITASIGAGHDGAARELVARLTQRGFPVDCTDLLTVFPLRLGRVVRGTYRSMLSRQPWIYDVLFRIACTFGGAGPATRLLMLPMRRRLLRQLPPDTVAVVSTFPLGSQILGPLRSKGRLTVPAITYLTDFAVHPIWVARGMDMHCAAHEVSRRQASAFGARDIQLAGRLVAPAFRPPDQSARADARRRLGLPLDERLALLVAGSWGVGTVERTVAEVARCGAATPVVVCGSNLELCGRLRSQGVAHTFGWVADMASLLQAVDVLIENAGGLTAMEAMACGVPVITYRPIAGHGTANAAAMAQAGVARWVRTAAALGPAITELVDGASDGGQRAAALALFESDPATTVANLAKAATRDQGSGRHRTGTR